MAPQIRNTERGVERRGEEERGGEERVAEERISNKTKCCQFINWNSGYLEFSGSILAIFP